MNRSYGHRSTTTLDQQRVSYQRALAHVGREYLATLAHDLVVSQLLLSGELEPFNEYLHMAVYGECMC
jgi:hypothetical protein